MKLELKHLSGYLPYELKVSQPRLGKIESYLLYGLKYSEYAKEWTVFIDDSRHGNYQNVYLKGIKPILRPLSDLTKDEHFELYMDLCEEIGVVRCEHLLLALQDNLKYVFNLQDLEALEDWMYKNHFDWKYNLIKTVLLSI